MRVEHIVLFNELAHSRVELIHEILPIITKIKLIHEKSIVYQSFLACFR